jgi:photosystem II stability/assembly factor-like uncharacterized protein
MIVVGYKLKKATFQEQMDNVQSAREVKREFEDHSYDLFGISYVEPDQYWVVGSNGVILHSEDNGTTWKEQGLDLTGDNLISVAFIDNQRGFIVGTSGIILETTNGGQAWKRSAWKVEDFCLKKVRFFDSQFGWIVGEGPTALVTFDGGENWAKRDVGKEFIILNDAAFISKTEGWIIGEQGTILFTKDSGSTWQEQTSNAAGSLLCIIVVNNNTALVSGLEGTLLKTEDKGITWQQIAVKKDSDVMNNHLFKCLWIPPIGFGNPYIYIFGDSMVAWTYDQGNSWKFIPAISNIFDVRFLWFYDSYFSTITNGIMVGKHGVIAQTVDSQHWTRVN